MAQTRAIPNEKQKSWYQQSLVGPYEASQTRINVSIILFLPAAPYYRKYWNIGRIHGNTIDMSLVSTIPNEKQKSLYSQSLMGPYEASQAEKSCPISFFLPVVPYYPKSVFYFFFNMFEVVNLHQKLFFLVKKNHSSI